MLISKEDFNMVKNKKACYIDTQVWKMTMPKITPDEERKILKKVIKNHKKKAIPKKIELSEDMQKLIKEV